MVEIVTEEGDLLGVVNVVDALVGLLALAMVVAGGALVLGPGVIGSSGASAQQAVTVTVEADVSPSVLAAFNQSDPIDPDVRAVSDAKVVETLELRQNATEYRNHTQRYHRVHLTATVDVSEYQGNAVSFRRQHLYVGRTLDLEFTDVVVEGRIVSIDRLDGGAGDVE